MNPRYKEFSDMFNMLLTEKAGGIGQSQLAEMLDASQPTISRIKKGELLPTKSMIYNIRRLWDVDISDDVERARANGSRISFRGTRSPQKSISEGIPYYDVDFVGGFDSVINDQTRDPAYLIKFKAYERADCWCNITGHSMEPEINHGDIIALRRIEDWRYIPFGEIYAIVTKNDMRTVKRIGPGTTKETFMLIPSNKSPEYAPQEIMISDILFIYEVMGCMKRF